MMPVAFSLPPMPHPASAPGPFGRFAEGLRIGGALVPSPLVATTIAVEIRGNLATVATTRRFRNAEATSIEATLTYPVPVDAVAHGLRVRIAGRTLVGQAQAKAAARATYEQAMDDGRTAILHEEPLKGVHVLSVGQVPPGAEVEVESSWTKAMSFRGDRAVLSVPTTVGAIYGRLPLDTGDEMTADGQPATAEVSVRAETAVSLCGEALAPGEARTVPLDRHITIAVEPSRGASLRGRSADGRVVDLSVRPGPGGDGPLDLVLLFDRSGSTSESFGPGSPSVHATAAAALRGAVARLFRPDDALVLWQFDSDAERLGAARGSAAVSLFDQLEEPRGGTEIGAAMEAAMADGATPRDLLLVTDGRSGALDLQRLAARGWRLSTLLCGPASLDALPGHLASLTGGQITVVGGGTDGVADVEAVAAALLGQLRAAVSPGAARDLPGLPAALDERRGGAAIAAAWSGEPQPGSPADAVGCYAAALALPRLAPEAATAIAIAHGLVTHLTSLVVVDPDGPVQATIPAQRKVPLPSPAFAAPMAAAMPRAASSAMPRGIEAARMAPPPAARPAARPATPGPRPRVVTLGAAAGAIDWTVAGPRLAEADLGPVEAWIRDAIGAAAATPDLVAAAHRANLDPIVLVVALMAARDTTDRTRDRIARRIDHLSQPERERLAALLGL